MGQHLHLYASKAVTMEEVAAWSSCRADEYFRTPAPGFEARAFALVADSMDTLRDTSDHWESGSTWAVMVWSRLWWSPYLITPELIEQCVKDAEYFMLWNEHLPHEGLFWVNGMEIEFLRNHIGYVGWGDNDGI